MAGARCQSFHDHLFGGGVKTPSKYSKTHHSSPNINEFQYVSIVTFGW